MNEKADFIGVIGKQNEKMLVRIDFISHIVEASEGCQIHLKDGIVVESLFSFSEVGEMLDVIYITELN